MTQSSLILRRRTYAVTSLLLAVVFSLSFLYLDEFIFVSPYFVVFIGLDRVPAFLLDLAISVLAGMVIVLSFYEIRTFRGLGRAYRRTGLLGIVAAFVAGACPCYYLVPLLAIAGGSGGTLAIVGVLLYDYQVQIKLSSLSLLILTAFVEERSLAAACKVQEEAGPPSTH